MLLTDTRAAGTETPYFRAGGSVYSGIVSLREHLSYRHQYTFSIILEGHMRKWILVKAYMF